MRFDVALARLGAVCPQGHVVLSFRQGFLVGLVRHLRLVFVRFKYVLLLADQTTQLKLGALEVILPVVFLVIVQVFQRQVAPYPAVFVRALD